MNIILTNTNSLILDEVLERSKVIILGESHLLDSDRENIAAIVNRVGNAQIFIEGCTPDMPRTLFPEIKNRSLMAEAKNWDTTLGIEKIELLIREKLYPHLKKGCDLLSRKLSEDVTLRSKEWVETYECILQKREKLVKETFDERTQKIFEVARDESERSSKRVVIISGRSHISLTEVYRESVQRLHDSFLQSALPFAILDQKVQINEKEWSAYYHEKKNQVLASNVKFELDVKNLEERYQRGKPIRAADLEYDIMRIALALVKP